MGRLTARRSRTSVAGVLAAFLVASAPLSASAATAEVPARTPAAQDGPIGGPALGRAGIVVDRSPGAPALPQVSAAGWLIADVDSGEVLAARNAHGKYLPASTMKTLTAVALLPEFGAGSSFLATRSCVSIEGSKVGLVAGMRYTTHALFESLLVVSGNDSANCLAEAVGGMAVATRLMNETARKLQANDTLAVNTSGLDAPGQLTSPYDLALINRAGLAMPRFLAYSKTLRSSMPAPGGRRFEIYNHNKLLTRYRGAIGVKTGYTIKARRTYVGAATRGGRTLLVTLLKAETTYDDTMKLLDWGFASAGKITPVGRLVDPLPDEPAVTVEPERADRSRPVVPDPVTSPAATAPAKRSTALAFTDPPVAGAGIVIVGVLVALRRRAIRRRRGYGPRAVMLRLPVK